MPSGPDGDSSRRTPEPRARCRPRWALLAGGVALAAVASGLGWARHLASAPVGLPTWPEPDPTDRILIIAPHPDDETLAAGGLIQRAVRRGAKVKIVILTRGDAFSVAARRRFDKQDLEAADYQALGRLREEESVRAVRLLGVGQNAITFLGYPDRALMRMWQGLRTGGEPYVSPFTGLSTTTAPPSRPNTGRQLVSDLRRIIRELDPTSILMAHPADSNADHAAASDFTESATAAETPQHLRSVGAYLVHHQGWPGWPGWPWARPLNPPSALALGNWQSFPLTPAETRLKVEAINVYSTQIAVAGRRLGAFGRSNELFQKLPIP